MQQLNAKTVTFTYSCYKQTITANLHLIEMLTAILNAATRISVVFRNPGKGRKSKGEIFGKFSQQPSRKKKSYLLRVNNDYLTRETTSSSSFGVEVERIQNLIYVRNVTVYKQTNNRITHYIIFV